MMGYGRGYGGYGGMMDGGGGWFFGLMMLLLAALFIALVVVLIMWAVRASHGGHGQSHAGGTPPMGSGPTSPAGGDGHHEAIAIAKKRLASGEITPEQYAEIMKHLGG